MTQEEQNIIFDALGKLSFCIGYMKSEQPDKCKEFQILLDKATQVMFNEARKPL